MEKVKNLAINIGDYTKDKFFRYVNNYEYCFKSYTKQRWLGRKIYEVFTTEFKAFSEEYYVILK